MAEARKRRVARLPPRSASASRSGSRPRARDRSDERFNLVVRLVVYVTLVAFLAALLIVLLEAYGPASHTGDLHDFLLACEAVTDAGVSALFGLIAGAQL